MGCLIVVKNMLHPSHLHEWKQSAVDPSLIALNVESLFDTTPYNYLFYALPRTERRNDGRLRDKWLKRYAHIEAGGWWCSGLDPDNNWEKMLWGRFKPDQPRRGGNDNKPIKYESPPKTPNRLTYFDIPDEIWARIAQRYGLTTPNFDNKTLCFWEWVQQHPELPILLTEGEKKAASLLTLGFVAIASPGIWGCRIGQKDFNETIHPDLRVMAQSGRHFLICFDYETRHKTRYAVYQAITRTGGSLQAVNCCCEVVSLPGPEKGVDDFIAAHKEEANALLTAIIDDALPLAEYRRNYWRKQRGLRYQSYPHVTINIPYLSQAVSLPESGLVVLWSDMGTGKTELLRKWRDEHPEARFLNNGHRVNLLKNLAQRLNTDIYSALDSGDLAKAKALSITIDSLYKLNTEANHYDCVFIDEACQYVAHLLHSKTCKEHRVEILEVLEYIIGKAKLVVLADAHMDDITLNFFRAMRSEHELPFIVKNEYKNGGREIFWYEGSNSSALVAQIFAALMKQQKVMVVSDSKRFIKKLEAAMTLKIVEDSPPLLQTSRPLQVWSIHAENSGSEENVAFIKNIAQEVQTVDVLLASPSLGTGVDIPHYHFDVVFGVFHAVSQKATECAQALHRYRPQVPMHIWVAPRPPFGYQEINTQKIRQRMLECNELTAFLIRIDRETGRRGCEKDWALDAYCQLKADHNQSLNNLREDLKFLLTEMGNTIIPLGNEGNENTSKKLKKAAESLDTAHFSAVAQACNISSSEYSSRQSKDYLTPEEIFECEKYRILDAYGMTVTEDLVKQDNRGSLIRSLAALEAILAPSEEIILEEKTGMYMASPPKIVSERDIKERDFFPLCMDWGNYSAQWYLRYHLGLHDILKRLMAGETVQATDPDMVKITQKAINFAPHIKAILNFTVPPNCQPMWLLAQLVGQLGLKLNCYKKGSRGKQVRTYFLAQEELEFALAVLKHRERKRAEREAKIQQRKEEQKRRRFTYGLNPSVSTPTPKEGSIPLEEGMDTPKPLLKKMIVKSVEALLKSMEFGQESVKGLFLSWNCKMRFWVLRYVANRLPNVAKQLDTLCPDLDEWIEV